MQVIIQLWIYPRGHKRRRLVKSTPFGKGSVDVTLCRDPGDLTNRAGDLWAAGPTVPLLVNPDIY